MKKRWKVIATTAVVSVGLKAALSFFYSNARTMPKLVTTHLDDVPPAGSHAFKQLLEKVIGSPIVGGNTFAMFKNGENIYPAMLDAISMATKSITLETYEYFGDNIPKQFALALAERAQQGVDVRVMLDYAGSSTANIEHFAIMTDAGVQLDRWRKPDWYHSSRFNFRTHRKLLIIDGKIGFTGGANIADPWDGTPSAGGVRDNHYRIEGPIVGHLQSAFMEHWLMNHGELVLSDAFYPELSPIGSITAQVVQSSPKEGKRIIRTLYLMAIASARKSIKLAVAFFYPDPMMVEALCKAAKKGIEIDIIVPGKKMETASVRFASRNAWGPLLEACIRIHEYDTSMYHAKTLIIDDCWVSIGSANFDNRSFSINDETNVNIFDADFTAIVRQSFEADLKECRTYTHDRWLKRHWVENIKGWAGNAFGPQL